MLLTRGDEFKKLEHVVSTQRGSSGTRAAADRDDRGGHVEPWLGWSTACTVGWLSNLKWQTIPELVAEYDSADEYVLCQRLNSECMRACMQKLRANVACMHIVYLTL
jgi:hypothetical protein